jgi:hypothetical protein
MTFTQFWPLYLRAHRLAGTRAMHYAATAVGVMAAIEAVIAQQLWVFVAGIALAYAMAIASHWFIENNQPLIRINAFWGAIADLRMIWLALTGRLGDEFARYGISELDGADAPAMPKMPEKDEPNPVGMPSRRDLAAAERVLAALDEFDGFARHAMRFYGARVYRYALLVAGALGLFVGLADLRDLVEPTSKLAYPLVQQGLPILAFALALASSCAGLLAAGRYSRAIHDGFVAMTADASSPYRVAANAVPFGLRAERLFARESSLRRASLALSALGAIAFTGAELFEHGLWWTL